jgi:hypothetical protein
MGYRSDVTIVMYPNSRHRDKFAALKLFVDENLPDEFDVIGEGNGRYLYCYIDCVKWYDDFEEVDKYNKLFSEWDEMFADPDDPSVNEGYQADPIFHYEFMRIGEEYDDVEYHCSYNSANALNMSREAYVADDFLIM